MVEALTTMDMTEHEAEGLFARLEWLQMHLPQLLAEFYGQEQA